LAVGSPELNLSASWLAGPRHRSTHARSCADLRPAAPRRPEPSAAIDQQAVAVDARHVGLDLARNRLIQCGYATVFGLVELPACLPSRQSEEPNAYLGPGVTLHSQTFAPIDQEPIAIDSQHAPFDALCPPHREVVAGTNVTHGPQGYRPRGIGQWRQK